MRTILLAALLALAGCVTVQPVQMSGTASGTGCAGEQGCKPTVPMTGVARGVGAPRDDGRR